MTTLLLLKFGEKEHIQDLYANGKIFINLLSKFSKRADNNQRFDFFEGIISNYYVQDGILELREREDEQWKTLKIYDSQFNHRLDPTKFYCYSMYNITKEDLQENEIYTIDKSLKELGSHFIMINKHITFLNRICRYLDSHDYKYVMGPVTYRDFTQTHSSLSLFDKSKSLSNQKEYRILVKADSEKPLTFEIGSLQNDASIYESEILSKLKMKLKK